MLTLDSYTFKGDANSADPSQAHQFTTQVVAMCGADLIQPTITLNQITPANGNPFNYTIDTTSSATQGGKKPIITIVLPAARADSVTVPGTIRIPVTVADGVTIDKDIAYSIAYKGTTGTGISGHVVQYQASNSSTTVPSGEWSASIEATGIQDGQFLWTRTTIYYTDGTSSASYSVSRSGLDGDEGRGITGTSVAYAIGSSGTVAPSAGWGANVPTVEQGGYLWTRTTVTYSSGDPSISYSVALQGTDGEDSIVVKLTSSAGVLFKNNNVNTTLTANVYRGSKQLSTAEINALGTIKWYKDGVLQTFYNGSLTYIVTASDVNGSAVFEAKLEG